jgi:muramoyltetrapeptide carboxypeptidase
MAMPHPLRLLPCITCLTILLLTAGEAISQHLETPAPIYAKALIPGDTIMFIAPAGSLDQPRMHLAKQRLEEMGFRVRVPRNLFRRNDYLAGSDEERAAELMTAFVDPEVDAIFPGTGGYGTTRIVDKLDYEVIRKNPKVFIGFSDITALHTAIHQRTGLVTFHSPTPMWGLGSDTNLKPYAANWFWQAILAASYRDPLTHAMRRGYTIETKAIGETAIDNAPLLADVPPAVTLTGGRAIGRLIGGNLSVFHALMGTPFEIETDGRILFIEDVGEAPYRVDRMLSTLRLAGKFDHLAGAVLGHFTRREGEDTSGETTTIDDVLREYFSKLGVPVLMHFPVGHVPYNATLPVGGLAELDADQQSLRILENPVVLAGETPTSSP